MLVPIDMADGWMLWLHGVLAKAILAQSVSTEWNGRQKPSPLQCARPTLAP